MFHESGECIDTPFGVLDHGGKLPVAVVKGGISCRLVRISLIEKSPYCPYFADC